MVGTFRLFTSYPISPNSFVGDMEYPSFFLDLLAVQGTTKGDGNKYNSCGRTKL